MSSACSAGPSSSGPSSSPRSAAGTTAGQGATLAAGYLARLWNAEKFAEIDPEGFLDFQSTRPHVSLDEGLTRRIEWPENAFYWTRAGGQRATSSSCSASSRRCAGARSAGS